ncbi:zinc-dependent metalloprotease [Jongsikchunia kroppenstedtii]|uniref:zinc-dependent metalloprotease n=1 Tax=Jongsikchunia kroppenstedtii TaxID=1121721 RepID=UPI0005B94A95|nr:zinc-dependent metalloprotease [Jongsikchunia kroppenstedtii]
MSDLPFGFSSSSDDDDDDKRGRKPSGDSGAGDPFGLGPGGPGAGGGFDPSQLGQMLSQLGQMLSGMGSGIAAGNQGEPVNYTLASQLARQQIGKHKPVGAGEISAVTDAVRLAETWLDGVTALPAGAQTITAWTPVEWLEKTLPTWKQLCNPVAEQLSGSISQGIAEVPGEAAEMAGPMMGILSSMGGMAFGSQLGQGLGILAKDVLSSTDIGLPLAPEGTAVLMPEAIAAFSDGLDLPAQEIIVFLAAREAAHLRLFSHVPWLRGRLISTVQEYARGIRMDFSGLTEAVENIDPTTLFSDPSKLEEIMQQQGSMFGPQTTPEQQQALARLETLLALIEGWVESVVRAALHDRIPSADALAETIRRRRASGGPAEQTFANLVGLELRPRKLREAAALWDRLVEAGDVTSRDAVWAHPDLIPDARDLDNPAAFIDRNIGGDSWSAEDLDDPMAALEKTIADEERKRKDDGENDSDTKDQGGTAE